MAVDLFGFPARLAVGWRFVFSFVEHLRLCVNIVTLVLWEDPLFCSSYYSKAATAASLDRRAKRLKAEAECRPTVSGRAEPQPRLGFCEGSSHFGNNIFLDEKKMH